MNYSRYRLYKGSYEDDISKTNIITCLVWWLIELAILNLIGEILVGRILVRVGVLFCCIAILTGIGLNLEIITSIKKYGKQTNSKATMTIDVIFLLLALAYCVDNKYIKIARLLYTIIVIIYLIHYYVLIKNTIDSNIVAAFYLRNESEKHYTSDGIINGDTDIKINEGNLEIPVNLYEDKLFVDKNGDLVLLRNNTSLFFEKSECTLEINNKRDINNIIKYDTSLNRWITEDIKRHA